MVEGAVVEGAVVAVAVVEGAVAARHLHEHVAHLAVARDDRARAARSRRSPRAPRRSSAHRSRLRRGLEHERAARGDTGAILCAARLSGKLNGETIGATPMGKRRAIDWIPLLRSDVEGVLAGLGTAVDSRSVDDGHLRSGPVGVRRELRRGDQSRSMPRRP